MGFAGLLGIPVALASVAYLWLIHEVQHILFDALPNELGIGGLPWWYLLAVLTIGGAATGLAVTRLRGNGGHRPLAGLGGGEPITPDALLGVLAAAVASLGFGAVLGPEAPLLAMGTALGLAVARLGKFSKSELSVVAAAGAFGALSALLGGPLIAAILVLELAVIASRPLIAIVPGLFSAGIGYLVFAETNQWAGAPVPSFSLGLTPVDEVQLIDLVIGVLGVLVIAILIRAVLAAARSIESRAMKLAKPVLTTAAAGLAVAVVAVAFRALTGENVDLVLFSGQESAGTVLTDGTQWGVAVLLAVVGAKSLAYALSLGGGFRGGLIFPAIFLGSALAALLEDLPGGASAPALATIAIAASVAAILRLPFTAAAMAVLLVGSSPAAMVLASVGAVLGLLVEMALDRRTREAEEKSVVAAAT